METSMLCPTCNRPVTRTVLGEYEDDLIGIGVPVRLVDSVIEERCDECGVVVGREIPDFDGLVAAVAVSRALHPLKLRGEELRFLRKALEVSAKELAEIIGVTQETMSRWENNRDPITPAMEKLIRFMVVVYLGDKAPAIDFDPKDVADMRIVSVCRDCAKPQMCFERVKVRVKPHRTEPHWDRLPGEAA